MPIHLKRTPTILKPDQSRVLLRPFTPGDSERVGGIVDRIMLLPEDQVGPLVDGISAEFSQRHRKISNVFLERSDQVDGLLLADGEISEQRRLLIGSYFLAEYSLESAALFNPSMVPHPDQTDLPPGALRFILSLRATGEGHISSITFRTGLLDARGHITINAPTRYCLEPEQVPNAAYENIIFERKLQELGLVGDFSRQVLQGLGSSFTLDDLRASLSRTAQEFRTRDQQTGAAARKIQTLAQSNYEVQFAPDSRLSERESGAN